MALFHTTAQIEDLLPDLNNLSRFCTYLDFHIGIQQKEFMCSSLEISMVRGKIEHLEGNKLINFC